MIFAWHFTFLCVGNSSTLTCLTNSGPSGEGGSLRVRLWTLLLSEGPFSLVRIDLLYAADCLAPRAAVLVSACCRVGWLAAGRTARAGAVQAWGAAAAQAA
jgi:hypothetical protein